MLENKRGSLYSNVVHPDFSERSLSDSSLKPPDIDSRRPSCNSDVGDVSLAQTNTADEDFADTSTLSDNASVGGLSVHQPSDKFISEKSIYSKGLCGFLERIPLFLKLFCTNGIWCFGLLTITVFIIIIRSQSLASGVSKEQFRHFVVIAGNLIHEAQKERGSTSLYINSNGTLYSDALKAQRLKTDKMLEEWDKFISSANNFLPQHAGTSPVVQSAVETILLSRSTKLYQIRNSTTPAIKIKASVSFEFFTEWIGSMLTIVYSTMGYLNEYALLVTLKEKTGQERATGSGMFAAKVAAEANLKKFNNLVIEQAAIADLFRKVASTETLELFSTTMVGSELDAVAAIEKYVSSLAVGTPLAIDSTVWFANTTVKIDKYKKIEDYLATKMLESTEIRDSIVYIVVLVSMLSSFIIFTIFLSFMVSRIIIGPWQRLNNLQEQTISKISKFVPKGFLKMINCKQIADVQVGTAVQRDLTALFSDIREFTSMSEKMTPEQNFQFINLYLSEVGPVIRKHGGYIDKFLGDGFMALFPKAKNGVMAAVEMQRRIGAFAMDEARRYTTANFRVGVGVHSGKMMVGTVGEHKRMDGSIIGDAVNLTSRLESLTKRYKAKILTTISTLSRISNASSHVSCRFLGKVKVKGKDKEIDIYEVLDGTEVLKEKTKDDFSKAVQFMMQNKFEVARELFDKILFENPYDYAAELKKTQCEEFIAAGVTNWDGIEVITEK